MLTLFGGNDGSAVWVVMGWGGGSNIATRGFANSNYDNPLSETIITIIDGGSGV